MRINRKEFLKMAGFAGAGLATFGAFGDDAPAGTIKSDIDGLPKKMEALQKKHKQRFNMSGYRAPKINTVRIGIIGTGNRGTHHAGTITRVSDVEIKAVADVTPDRFDRVKKKLANP